ncbi:hypothetical protein [uncultured Sphaerochaeta sp.]|uniref:hypothetical protein n=1 Tax=uncultured Sphaerochaeta sp. TaxID=886478 RepID=UPI002A0A1111|nr:hypothetical protein [uncultured Sphaerochaeta sp.]
MPLSKEDRNLVFNTPVIARQLQKYIEAKREVSLASIREVFPEISPKILERQLAQLRNRGIVTMNTGVYIATYDQPVQGESADHAWQAARILVRFKPEDIARVGGINIEHARQLCRTWRQAEFLVVIGRCGKVPIYKLYKDQSVRPIIAQRRKQ